MTINRQTRTVRSQNRVPHLRGSFTVAKVGIRGREPHSSAPPTRAVILNAVKDPRFSSSCPLIPEPWPLSPESGLTLVELIITFTILGILATAAIPIARFQVKREKERTLRRDLWEMRDAIDRYKDAADKGGFQIKADSLGYPDDLTTLVDGVDIQSHKVRFLRAIPIDPMTGQADWTYVSNQDEPDTTSWGGQNVFNVHSKSTGTALDGTKYSSW